MINLMLYILVPTTVLMSITYYLLQRRLAAQQLKKQDEFAHRINNIKASFKATMELFVMQRVIRPTHVSKLFNIVNNYFVNQPITEENVKKLEKLANRIAITIAKEVNMSKNDAETEWVKKKLLNFAILLPSKNADYTPSFYGLRIKKLLQGLNCTKSSFIQRHAA